MSSVARVRLSGVWVEVWGLGFGVWGVSFENFLGVAPEVLVDHQQGQQTVWCTKRAPGVEIS